MRRYLATYVVIASSSQFTRHCNCMLKIRRGCNLKTPPIEPLDIYQFTTTPDLQLVRYKNFMRLKCPIISNLHKNVKIFFVKY